MKIRTFQLGKERFEIKMRLNLSGEGGRGRKVGKRSDLTLSKKSIKMDRNILN